MIIDLAEALVELCKEDGHKFVMYGIPKNQTEWQANVKFVSGEDENKNAIFSETQPFTYAQAKAKLDSML
jgi:hypothetical protein|tara:strand:- start:59 stop:268 length:210 start_codon:yes stop_codon:yes gene_type:complete